MGVKELILQYTRHETLVVISLILCLGIGFSIGLIHKTIDYEMECNKFITDNYIIPQLEEQGYVVKNGVVFKPLIHNYSYLNFNYSGENISL